MVFEISVITFESSNFSAVFGDDGLADLEDDEGDVEVLLSCPDVLDASELHG